MAERVSCLSPTWPGPQPAGPGSGETRRRAPPGTGAAERVPRSPVEGPCRSARTVASRQTRTFSNSSVLRNRDNRLPWPRHSPASTRALAIEVDWSNQKEALQGGL
jgi:hypothetical protein